MRRKRSSTTWPTTAVPVASATSHVALPSPTPATRSTAPPNVLAAPAALAAEKIAAHDAIVSGLDAVERDGDRERTPTAHRRRHVTEPDPERAQQRPHAQEDEHGGPDEPEDRLQRPDREQRSHPGGAERRVPEVDDRDPQSERHSHLPPVPERRPDQVERDRPQLQRHEEPEPEPDCERMPHGAILAENPRDRLPTVSRFA